MTAVHICLYTNYVFALIHFNKYMWLDLWACVKPANTYPHGRAVHLQYRALLPRELGAELETSVKENWFESFFSRARRDGEEFIK